METGQILFTFDKLLIVVGVHLFLTSVSTLGVSVTIDSLILEPEIVLTILVVVIVVPVFLA